MKRYTVAALLAGALACTESNAPPVQRPGSFNIVPALDTVEAGVSVTFVAERDDSIVDAWQVSDSSAAHIQAHDRDWARVKTLAAGRVTITAMRQGDSGQATLVILPMPPPPPDTTDHASFAIRPALDTAIVGELVQFVADPPDSTVYQGYQWSVSDTTLAQRRDHSGRNWTGFIAHAAGTVTITASRQGDTGHATLVIRNPEPGTTWEAIDLGLLVDARQGVATAIGDDGAVVGRMDSAYGPDCCWAFIYKDGAMHKLLSGGPKTPTPAVIGPTGRILGTVYDTTDRLVVWDTPDAAPRRFGGHDEIAAIVGINERGDVLVTAHFELYKYYRGVLWRNNMRVDLGDFSDSTVVSPSTMANAWNGRGQIVGWSQVRTVTHTDNQQPTSVLHPFLWENGVMRDLGVLAPLACTQVATPADCSWAVAMDINADGVIVGSANGADGKTRAVIWENGVIRDLGVNPGHYTTASAINDRGQVLGYSETSGVFLWENGQIQSTILMDGLALGPNGEVIGRWCPGMGADHGDCPMYIWQAGRITDLGSGEPLALNGHGEIVGWRECCGHKRPMLWRRKR